jgi:photosystem I P700 chlorophyll a apoprotein A2
MWKPRVLWLKHDESHLNHHLPRLFEVSSLAWTEHLVHVATPGIFISFSFHSKKKKKN